MLIEIFNKIRDWVTSLGPSQYVALFVCALALFCAKEIMQKGVSIILSIVGVLAALYFFAPSLYTSALDMIRDVLSNIVA